MPDLFDGTPFPRDFLNSFLCNAENKNDLGLFIASKLISLHRDVGDARIHLIVTFNDSVSSFPVSSISPGIQIASTSEEADQKIIRHTLDCIKNSYAYMEVHSIDCDVLILLIAYFAADLETSQSSDDDPKFNLHFKLLTSDPTWYNVVSLIEKLGIDVCKAM